MAINFNELNEHGIFHFQFKSVASHFVVLKCPSSENLHEYKGITIQSIISRFSLRIPDLQIPKNAKNSSHVM